MELVDTQLSRYAPDHRSVLEQAARAAGFEDPVAVELDEFKWPLLRAARKGPVRPLHGVMLRDWDPDVRRGYPGLDFGLRLYDISGLRFAYVTFNVDCNSLLCDFAVVDRKDYQRLYRVAARCRREQEGPVVEPVLAKAVRQALWDNSIGYLDRHNLRRIREFGGRPRRGILLTGPPGNGKTLACRWLWEECRRRRWDWRLVTPDDYAQARRACNAAEAVRQLFDLQKTGIVFFDDLDLALRDRDTTRDTDDQAVFLGGLDGITVHEGVVYVFTTNCPLERIDRAFKRPGRIDVVLEFPPPDADLRRELIGRWHADIRGALEIERVLAATAEFSFAELEELKNLLIVHFMGTGCWDFEAALKQFEFNRRDLASAWQRPIGFAAFVGTSRNGDGAE